MTEQPRDWDRELADIDKAIEKSGRQGTPGNVPALPGSTSAPARAPAADVAPSGRRSVAMTWFWVILAVLLAAALPLWPYGKECGLQLFFYLGATTLALLAGGAGAISSWATRRGVAHILALAVLVVALGLGAIEILPRVGYAAEAKTWFCPATPGPAPQQAPSP